MAAAQPEGGAEPPGEKRRPHGMLKLYYGLPDPAGEALADPARGDLGGPTDINGPHFDPEIYLTKLRKECPLAQLMDCETDMVKQIRALDSDMQTLVYENYNKFISATGVHALLRKLQFLFELPARLTKCVELAAYGQAVRDGGSGAKDLAECVELLLQLGEPAEELCDEFLSHAHCRLEAELRNLEAELGDGLHFGAGGPATDILEFTDRGCNSFVSNICLVIASYQELFINREGAQGIAHMAHDKLVAFVDGLMACYFALVERRIQLEKGVGDNSLLVRALDRFHRRLQALAKLLPASQAAAVGTEIVARAAKERIRQYLEALQSFYLDCLTDVRQSLAAPRLVGKENPSLAELLGTISSAILNQIKSVLTYIARQFCESPGDKGGSSPPALLLLLSRFCLDYETATISYILTLTDEQFLVQDHSPVTPVTVLCAEAREAAQKLLNHYVKVQGLIISQMLRKSVETRDWISTIEPRNVRAVMKRVVEDATSIDVQVGLLYEEGVRKAQSSDSSKRTFSISRQQSRYAPSYTPRRIPSEFAHGGCPVSVLTGIIKISLKTFLECVRLRTFGRFGLQQIQVDCYYLQLYLWRFVSDENLVHFLLDEIVGSTAHRCLDPVPMEQSVIEVICERG
ncbi:hypothetical protein Chor_014877 [Crotalus horridus]